MELTFKEGSLEAGLEETFRQIQVLQNKVNGTDVIRLQREKLPASFKLCTSTFCRPMRVSSSCCMGAACTIL